MIRALLIRSGRSDPGGKDSGGLWRTTTFRLSVGFGGVFALGVFLVLGLVYVQTSGALVRRADRILAVEAAGFVRSGPQGILQRFRQEAARDPLSSFGLFTASGERVAGASRLTPAELPVDGGAREPPHRPGEPPRRGLATRLPWGEVLVVERDSSQLTELRRIIVRALAWSGAVTLLVGLLSGVALSMKPLRRLQAIREAGAAIAAGDLGVRLPVEGGGDEIDELAGVVNAMMGELERLIVQARTVGEGVAHELRTPLTRLRATLDHAYQAAGPGGAAKPLLERCLAETDGLLGRFRALLRIAAVEARSRQGLAAEVSLGALVEQVGELYAPLAAERGLELAIAAEGGLRVRADGELLFEAVSNLVDNALKFTPAGGRIAIACRRSAADAEIEVRDDGPGIAEAERALVTQRFYRSQRNAGVEGHGLGLSLVAAVAAMHGFRLIIEDAEPGTAVRLICPERGAR